MGSRQSAFQGWNENAAPYSRIIMNENDPIAWENIIRKCIEDELYASSKLEVGIVLYPDIEASWLSNSYICLLFIWSSRIKPLFVD